MNPRRGSHSEKRPGAFSWPAFVLVAITLAIAGGYGLLESERRDADNRLASHADEARTELQRRLRQQEAVLQSMVAFIQVSPGLDTAAFATLVERLIQPYPHIRSVHFHQLVPGPARAEFEAEMRARGYDDYAIVERDNEGEALVAAAPRERYMPVTFAAPISLSDDRRLLGLDLLVEPEVRDTVIQALEHGVAAGPVAFPMRDSDAGYFLVRELRFDGVLGRGARGLMSIAAHSGQLLPAEVRPPGVRVWLEGPGLSSAQRPEVAQHSRFPFGLNVVQREVEVGGQTLRMIMQRQRSWGDLNGTGLLLLMLVALAAGWGTASLWGQRRFYREQLIHARRQAQADDLLVRAIAGGVSDGIIMLGRDERITSLNTVAENLTGWRSEDAVGCRLAEVVRAGDTQQTVPDTGHAAIFSLGRRDGELIPVHLRRIATGREAADPTQALILRDARHELPVTWPDGSSGGGRDHLTGLPGRKFMQQHLEALMARSQQLTDAAVLVISLPGLRLLREEHDAGSADELMRLAARILDIRRRSEDVLVRLDDSRLALLLQHCSLADARKVAGALLEALRECRYTSAGRYLEVVPCAGIAGLAPGAGAEEILRLASQAADMAEQQAGRVFCSTAGDRNTLAQRHGGDQWTHRLLEALEEQRFELYAQPVIDLSAAAGKVHHHEVLLRIRDEQGELFTPADFIPLAEREQLMARADHWVLEQALTWLASHPAGQRVMLALNLSAQSLADDDLIARVRGLLARTGVSGRCLRFELKEPVAAARMGTLGRIMDELRRDGVSFCLDNFGTGPNGFLPLRQLTPEALKIDATLIRAAGTDIGEAAIVEAICHVARTRGMEVAAEGVEDAETLDMVRKLGIRLGQGHYLGEPEPLTPR